MQNTKQTDEELDKYTHILAQMNCTMETSISAKEDMLRYASLLLNVRSRHDETVQWTLTIGNGTHAIVQTYNVRIHLASRMLDLRLLQRDCTIAVILGKIVGTGREWRGSSVEREIPTPTQPHPGK